MKHPLTYRYTKVCTVVFLVFILSACKKENRFDCIKRTGAVIKESRVLEGFHQIIVDDNINVFITHDSVYEVIVEAGKNIVPEIVTAVSEKILTIANHNRCNWTRSYKTAINVYVKTPLITQVISNGGGNIKSLNTINTKEITIKTFGAGDIELTLNSDWVWSQVNNNGDIILHGNTKDHYCGIGQSAFLYAKDFHTDYTWLHSTTTGLCYLNVERKLDCDIEQLGDVYCYGNPTEVNNVGKGKGVLYLK